MDDALNALFQMRDIEVDQQTDVALAQFQISDELCPVYWQQPFDGFQLYDHVIFDQKIDLIPGVERDVVVCDWQAETMLEGYLSLRELEMQARVIGAFEESSTKRRVNVHSCGNDAIGDVFVEQSGPPCPPLPPCGALMLQATLEPR